MDATARTSVVVTEDNQVKKVLLTFGDGGENYVAARKRVATEARQTGCFDAVYDCGWEDVPAEAVQSPLRQYKRGCGYWIWKPFIVLRHLEQLADGDILVWSDCGNVLYRSRQWKKFFKRMELSDIICRRIPSCAFLWHRKELLEAFTGKIDRTQGIKMCYDFETGQIFFKKSAFVMRFVREWRDIMFAHPEFVQDPLTDAEKSAQLPTFIDNRHDQSVFTMLFYAYLSKGAPIDSVWEFHSGFPFGNPAIHVARWRRGDRFAMGPGARLKRVLYRILWRFERIAERRGVRICWTRGRY